MLIVRNPVGTLVARMVFGKSLGIVLDKLTNARASFYVEPYPNSEWRILVASEHQRLLEESVPSTRGYTPI